MIPVVALRNLFRNRRRSLLSLMIVSVGTAGLLLTAGFVRHSFHGLREAIIRGGLGHLEVAPVSRLDPAGSAADPFRPLAFHEWQQIRSTIESQPYVQAAGATIQFGGIAVSGERSASFFGVAVEPERETRMGVNVRLRGGTNLPDAAPPEGEEQVLLGVGLARSLGVSAGEIITLLSSTADGSLNALDLTVAGVFTTGFQDLDGRILKTHLAAAQRLLAADAISSLIVSLADTEAMQARSAELREILAEAPTSLEVLDWESRAPFYGQVRALYSAIFIFLGTIVALLVALSISNTLLMSVLERIREFGMLLAIGTSRAQLAFLLILEALWLALLGGLAGGVLGKGLVTLINALEIQMPPPPAAVDPITLALAVVPSDYLWALAFMAAVLSVAAVPPIFRLFRLQIVEALGHV